MSIAEGLLPIMVLVAALLLSMTVLVVAVIRVNWQVFKGNSSTQHFFFAATIALALFWAIRTGLSPGLGIHFMGLTAATLLMGWPLAMLAGVLALIGVTIGGLEAFEALGINFLLSVALPVFTSHWVLHWVQRTLPYNPFVYIFLGGFFNGAIAIAIVASATALMIGGLEIYQWEAVYENYFQYLPLMLFPEAFINGMIVASLVGTVPEWLSSFDQDKYFRD